MRVALALTAATWPHQASTVWTTLAASSPKDWL